MVTYVLDSSALLRYLEDDAGSELVDSIIRQFLLEEIGLQMSAVQWGEVCGYMLKVGKQIGLDKALAILDTFGIQIVPADSFRSMRAAAIKVEHDIPYADAFAAELAMEHNKILLTGDYDFAGMKSLLKIEFLPRK